MRKVWSLVGAAGVEDSGTGEEGRGTGEKDIRSLEWRVVKSEVVGVVVLVQDFLRSF